MHSAIYEGRVRHRRLAPVMHSFDYNLFMMYLDLDELPRLFDNHWLWSNEGRALARFRRADHLIDHASPTCDLSQGVRDLVMQRTGERPSGPIRLLTHLEYFRHRFNPVNFFFCFDVNDQHVEAVIAEINNTPWGEQHCYVLSHGASSDAAKTKRFRFEKAFHISPFMGMDTQYDWRFTDPGQRLTIHMKNLNAGESYFDATMSFRRREISSAALAGVLLKYPVITLRVTAAIYLQALVLRLKGCPRYPHPKTLTKQNNGA